jgi:hypothetical protein
MWNSEQLQFIHAPNTDGTLIGIPGGGKTRCILGRILHLIDTKEIKGFIVCTFSRLACNDFRIKGSHLRKGVFDTDKIRTIHSLSHVITSAYGVSCGIDTVVYRASKIIEKHRNTLRDSVYCLEDVNCIFVDEAQDISGTQYAFVCALRDALGVPLVLVGDPNQNIYQFQGGSDKYLRNHKGFCVELVKNYRSTQSIVAVSNAARPLKGSDMQCASGEEGVKPVLVSHSIEKIQRLLVAEVRQCLEKGELVAIIGPVKNSYRLETGYQTRLGLQWAAQTMRIHGIAVHLHYVESASDDHQRTTQEIKDIVLDPKKVHMFTMHGSKGLEFDHVMLLNFHYNLMGKKPTTQDGENFKYLMFVGVSRAKRTMHAFRLSNADVWPGWFDMNGFMELDGDPPKQKTLDYDVKQQIKFQWTSLLRDRVMMDEEHLTQLEDMYALKFHQTGVTIRQIHLPDEEQLSELYGAWAENTFYHHYRGGKPPCMSSIEDMLHNTIIVPMQLSRAVNKLRHRFGLTATDMVPLSLLTSHPGDDDIEPSLREFLTNYIETNEEVFLHIQDICRWFNAAALQELIEASKQDMTRECIWRMCLFLWQYRAEASYRWNRNYDAHIKTLDHYETWIIEEARKLPDGYKFQVKSTLLDLPITGIVDCVNEKTKDIIELKFTRSFQTSYGLQVAGYAMMMSGEWNMQVVNLRTQKNTTVTSPALKNPDPILRFLGTIITS